MINDSMAVKFNKYKFFRILKVLKSEEKCLQRTEKEKNKTKTPIIHTLFIFEEQRQNHTANYKKKLLILL